MELAQLSYFKTVAEQQSIKKAAEILHISQPSLSVAISKLEASLGVPLFDRVNRSIRLNAMGAVYLEHVNRIFNELAEARLEIAENTGSVPNTIHFASTIHGLCNDVVKMYLGHHNETIMHYYSQDADSVLKGLKNGDIDFSISHSPFQAKEIEWKPLVDENLAVVTCKTHRFVSKGFVDLVDLKDEQLIIQHSNSDAPGEYSDLFLTNGLAPSRAFFTNELEAAFAIAELGLGVLVVSYLTAHRLMKNPVHTAQIVPLRLPHPIHTKVGS